MQPIIVVVGEPKLHERIIRKHFPHDDVLSETNIAEILDSQVLKKNK